MGKTNPAYKSTAPTAIPTALPAAPKPANPLPIAAAAMPETMSALPAGRFLIERMATPTTASVQSEFARIASRRAGRKARWLCASGIPWARNAPCNGMAREIPIARPE